MSTRPFPLNEYVLILTCEHGGNEIPFPYTPYFSQHHDLLQTHRGFDPGALHMAEEIVKRMNTPFHGSKVSRLLVELNRSLHNHNLWSVATKDLSLEEKEKILAEHYHPHRDAAEKTMKNAIAQGKKVIHIAMHSFTPEPLGEDPRDFDIGILFDPDRSLEKLFSEAWKESLEHVQPDLRVVYNRPYHGTDDGFSIHLREQMDQEVYASIELEVNQGLIVEYEQLHAQGKLVEGVFPENIIDTIVKSLEHLFPEK